MGLSNDGVNLDRSHIGTGSPIEFVVLGLLRLSLASSPRPTPCPNLMTLFRGEGLPALTLAQDRVGVGRRLKCNARRARKGERLDAHDLVAECPLRRRKRTISRRLERVSFVPEADIMQSS